MCHPVQEATLEQRPLAPQVLIRTNIIWKVFPQPPDMVVLHYIFYALHITDIYQIGTPCGETGVWCCLWHT